MSKCWKCGKDFDNQNNLGATYCNECALKILKSTATSDTNYMHIIDFEDYLNAKTQAEKDEIAKGFYDCLQGTTKINCDFIKENAEIKAEIEELKENNIETKFKVGQTIYTPFVGAAEDIGVFEIKHISIEWSSAYKKHYVYYYIDDKYYYEEKQLFSTKKEALKKLEENKMIFKDFL